MLTASIVIHNSPVGQVLKAIDCMLRSGVERVYLLDNSTSPFDTAALPSDHRIDYRRIPNRGFGAGHNVALREVLKDHLSYHLVMNADVEWDGDALSPLVDYMEKNGDVGMVQPRIVYPDRVLQYTCRLLPTPWDLFAKRFLSGISRLKPGHSKREGWKQERYLLMEHDHRKALEVAYLQGSFMLFRNKALAECGVFDERFFMYPEDIDITRRMHQHWKTLYLPIVEITHYHQAASRHNLKMFGIHLWNMIKYFNKWGWLIDRERRSINRRILSAIQPYPAGEKEIGRG